MKNLFIGAGTLLVLSMTVGCKKAAVPQQGPLPVNFVTVVEKGVNEWDEFTGRLEAVESVDIRPRVSGYVTEIHFEAGAVIKKGDLLYVIDPRPYQADFDRAEAELEQDPDSDEPSQSKKSDLIAGARLHASSSRLSAHPA